MINELNQMIKEHERAIEILEAIKAFDKRIQRNIESINGFAGTFPRLKKKYLNDIDTQKKCVYKLIDIYSDTVKKNILS